MFVLTADDPAYRGFITSLCVLLAIASSPSKVTSGTQRSLTCLTGVIGAPIGVFFFFSPLACLTRCGINCNKHLKKCISWSTKKKDGSNHSGKKVPHFDCNNDVFKGSYQILCIFLLPTSKHVRRRYIMTWK